MQECIERVKSFPEKWKTVVQGILESLKESISKFDHMQTNYTKKKTIDSITCWAKTSLRKTFEVHADRLTGRSQLTQDSTKQGTNTKIDHFNIL